MGRKKDEDEFIWQVTYFKDKPVSVRPGEELSRYTSDSQLRAIGQMMVTLGSRLMASSVEDDEDYWDDDED